jgi:hypothetical protein
LVISLSVMIVIVVKLRSFFFFFFFSFIFNKSAFIEGRRWICLNITVLYYIEASLTYRGVTTSL